MKDETRQEISAAYAKDYTDWMVKTGGYARDMTMRDHFAALAMQTLTKHFGVEEWLDWSDERIVDCYEIADAMLMERIK